VTGEVLIREALEEDLPGVLALYAQPGLDDGQTLSVEEARLHYRRFKQYPNYRLFVAELNGEIVGTFALLIMDNLAHLGAPSGVVEDVVVTLKHQSQGIGRRMMEVALENCRQSGCYKMALSSNLKREAAHAFYESLGFEKHGYSFRVVFEQKD
jgi:GNAT superfamily N-acetyltransferase